MVIPQDYRDVIGNWSEVHDLTLSLNTSQYADGDVLADRQELANVLGIAGGAGVIQSLLVLDKDDQGAALDIIFLDANVTIGTENSAVSITDANAEKIIGNVEVAAADYVDMINNQHALKANLGIPFKCAAAQTSIWVAAVSRGTGTYTASGIILKVGILPGL